MSKIELICARTQDNTSLSLFPLSLKTQTVKKLFNNNWVISRVTIGRELWYHESDKMVA